MENSGEVTIEGENYEVVDECIEEDDTSNTTKNKLSDNTGNVEEQSVSVTLPDNTQEENPEQNKEVVAVDNADKSLSNNANNLLPDDANNPLSDVANNPLSDVANNPLSDVANNPLPDVANNPLPDVANNPLPDVANDPLPDNSNLLNNMENNELNVESKHLQKPNMESIDFTADINLDQLDEQNDTTDEDVLNHLNEIENIILDPADFQIQEEDDQTEKTNTSRSQTDEVVIDTETCQSINPQISDDNNTNIKQEIKVEIPEKNDWYERKLAEKEMIIKERLSKVARVLGISYPYYEKWLEWVEKVNGTPLCKLKPARRCCLDKPYTNRWKFICNKRKIEETQKDMAVTEPSSTVNKNTEVWKLEASGACGTNMNNEFEFPPFVLRAVKIFEDFLQTIEQSNAQNCTSGNFSDDISYEVESKKEINNEGKQEWLWLLVRCNSMDELMLFATGRNISCSTMNRLKQVYESGPGKDCNVKSLYCKSINKSNDVIVTNTTFLVGSEALDEVVGGLKIQLAPKTNFWSNTAGAENIANAVMELLVPTLKTTVLEIGCGIGLIGLMMASKCQQIIGVDSPSEVEEAEMTCELNNIKNASFIMGTPIQISNKIVTAVKNRKTCAVINANTNIGRAIEVMTCLRKIPSLKRIVMITTLTKQSVRAMLELARPMDSNHAPPFIPILARVVDTLPVGPHFEAVILLQRRTLNKFNQQWFQKTLEESGKALDIKNNLGKTNEQNTDGTNDKILLKGIKIQTKKNFNKSLIKHPIKKSKIVTKKPLYLKNIENSIKHTFKGKRSHSSERGEAPPKKIMKRFNKSGSRSWQPDLSAKIKKEWIIENPQLRVNPLYEKKIREPKEQTDLRERLSNNRLDTDIAQTVKEHQVLLEIAKEKLSGPAPTVDVNTAKQLQNMLNMVLEQTNKLQNQLPRSVWDRIAPPENVSSDQRGSKEDPLLKGRYIQEMGSQDILITAPNKKFLHNEEPMTKPMYKKYGNLPPLEPNTIMPVSQPSNHEEEEPFRMTANRYESNVYQHQTQEAFMRNRWIEMENMNKSLSSMRKQTLPMKHRLSPPRTISPKRSLLPSRRPSSPPKRHFSPVHRPPSPMYRQRSPIRHEMPSLRRPMSPKQTSPSRRAAMPLNRQMSPLRRQISPPRRQLIPMMRSVISPRRQLSPMRRPVSPPSRQIPSPNQLIPPGRQEMLLSRRQMMTQERQTSPLRRGRSPQRFMFELPASISRRPQSPQRRQPSPLRFNDDWDIPNREAIEQNTWSRPAERISDQNVWGNEKTSSSNNNWDQGASNDRQWKSVNQEKWNTKDSVRNNTWISGENSWTPKQLSTKPTIKEESGFDNRWSTASNMPGSSNENWNTREKETYTTYKEPWMDNKRQVKWESLNTKDSWKHCDKEDLNDLPEDAKDPWGDDGTSDLKERWFKLENATTLSTRTRDNEQQGNMWSKNKDNWQNKGSSFGLKSQWQNKGIPNIGESRWRSQNDMKKKTPSNTWQSGSNVGSWQFQNSNFQSQQTFPTSQFKSSY